MKTPTHLMLLIATALMCCGCNSNPSDPGALVNDAPPMVVSVELNPFFDEDAANREAGRAMEQPITLDAQDLLFASVIDYIQSTTDVNIAVRWEILELSGIEKDSLVSFKTKQMPARQLLHLALGQVNHDVFDHDRVGHTFVDGAIVISTQRDLARFIKIRVYDVNWFIRPSLPIDELMDEFDDSATGPDQDNHIEWVSTSPATKQRPNYFLSRSERIGQIQELITELVGDPEDWFDEEYVIYEFDGLLVIGTTYSYHQEIEALLAAMHTAQIQNLKQQARFRESAVHIQRAETLRLEGKYRQALRAINRALHIDPGSLQARAIRDVIEEAKAFE